MKPEDIVEDIENIDSPCEETRKLAFMNISLCLLGKDSDIFDKDGCLHGMAGDDLFERCIDYYRRVGLYRKVDQLEIHKQLWLGEYRTYGVDTAGTPIYLPAPAIR